MGDRRVAVSVIVNDLDLLRAGGCPHEADAPLVIDTDAVLTSPSALQRFQTVPRRDTELSKCDGGAELTELAQCRALDPRVERSDSLSIPQPFRVAVGERPDHEITI
jgi:hypothetical protein